MHGRLKNTRVVVACAALAIRAVSAETLVWTGAESQNWDLTAVNWTNASGVATAWVNGSDAFFTAEAASPVSVTANVTLRNLRLATRKNNPFKWNDGGGSLTFASDAANPTNYIMLGNDSTHHELHARVTCAAPLVKQGNSVLSLHNANNSFIGGIIQTESQLRFTSSGALGPGAVTLLGNSTAFCDDAVAPDVKFIQHGDDGNLLGSVGPLLTIKSVGATADNTARVFHIGRGANECTIALSLTDPESEDIGQYILHGSSSTFSFDGGVVKASPVTKDFFFSTTANATPAARVTNNGVTFDTAGASTELGLKLQFDAACAITNVLETFYPNDWSFENETLSANWSVDYGQNTGEWSTSQPTNSAFMKAKDGGYRPYFFTTNGARFAVVRRGHTISQNVTLPSAGLWRVVYERGCRPHDDFPSQGFEVTVSLGGQSSISPGQADKYTFRREETALFELEAGRPLSLSFAVSYDPNGNRAVYLDAIRLERCEVIPIPVGPLVKTGVGTLGITNLVTDGFVAVSNGTLAVKSSTLDGTSVDVVSGGTLELYATKVTNATVNVSAGGALSFRDGTGRNLVVNGGFEDNLLSERGYQAYDQQDSGPRGWSLTYANTPSGIQANRSDMSASGYFTSCGRTTAYFRPNSEMRQTVTVADDGIYEVSFLHGCRVDRRSYTIPLTVLVDGVAVASNGTRSADYDFERCTARVSLAAGDHVLAFVAGSSPSSNYPILFVDDVRLASAEGVNALDGNVFAFASGATLDLQNAEPIYLSGGVTVDGRPVTGGANSLRRAGVVVTGPGAIQIGPPRGSLLIFR